MVSEGLGYYQERGQPIRLLRKGEVIQAQPGVEHWPGAASDSLSTHLAINPNISQGVADWLQPVTDKEYHAAQG